MSRPRILLVPTLCEIEWRIKPQLEEWADVAAFDAPGVGDEPPTSYTTEAIAERGLAELDRRDWDRAVVAGDEFGTATAVHIAAERPKAVEALVLGHACLSLRSTGERAPLNGEVLGAFNRLRQTDYRSYVRALGQITQGAYDEDFEDRYLERVSKEAEEGYQRVGFSEDELKRMDAAVKSLQVPLLLAEHKGCLLFTREGYEDAVAAHPDAETASVEVKPSASPEFAAALKEFCARLPAMRSGARTS